MSASELEDSQKPEFLLFLLFFTLRMGEILETKAGDGKDWDQTTPEDAMIG